MTKWIVHTASLIPLGRLDEVLYVFCRDGADTAMLRAAPTKAGESVNPDDALITAASLPGGAANEIDEFLQAMLDAAWTRGLRPLRYEGPQELAAVKYHLEDMRTLAGVKPKPV